MIHNNLEDHFQIFLSIVIDQISKINRLHNSLEYKTRIMSTCQIINIYNSKPKYLAKYLRKKIILIQMAVVLFSQEVTLH